MSKIHSAMITSNHEIASWMEGQIKEKSPQSVVDMDFIKRGAFEVGEVYYVFRPLAPKATALAIFTPDSLSVTVVEIIVGNQYDRARGRRTCDGVLDALGEVRDIAGP